MTRDRDVIRLGFRNARRDRDGVTFLYDRMEPITQLYTDMNMKAAFPQQLLDLVGQLVRAKHTQVAQPGLPAREPRSGGSRLRGL